MGLAHGLGKHLHELMGWPGPMTHRQFQGWVAWHQEQNRRMEEETKDAGRAGRGRSTRGARPKDRQQAAEWAQQKWMGAVGMTPPPKGD